VAKTFCNRAVVLAVGFALAIGSTRATAPAALDVFVGARKVVKNQPLSACNAGAKSALSSVLQNASEVGDTGEWKASGPSDASGNAFAAAAIHCYPLDDVQGYLVTFTCAVQAPPNPDTASALCGKLTDAFGAGGQR